MVLFIRHFFAVLAYYTMEAIRPETVHRDGHEGRVAELLRVDLPRPELVACILDAQQAAGVAAEPDDGRAGRSVQGSQRSLLE